MNSGQGQPESTKLPGWGELARPSAIALVAANLIPLLGVVIFGWKTFPLMLIFWLENVVVGLFNVLKMALVETEDGASGIIKLFLIPFFCMHYGIFTLVHGMFVIALFSGGFAGGGPVPDAGSVWRIVKSEGLIWGVLGLVASHGISFADNYIRKEEYRRTSIQMLMAQPYGRIIVLHIAILGGAFLLTALKSPVWGLILLVVLKIALDLRSHTIERRKFSTP